MKNVQLRDIFLQVLIYNVLDFAATYATILPTMVEPVKQIKSTFYLFNSTATSIAPSIQRIKSGSKYLSTNFFITLLVFAAISEGLIITAFPDVIAYTNGFSAVIIG